MYYSHYIPYYGISPYQNDGFINRTAEDSFYYQNNHEDERFFFPLIPFVAGLAIGPLLFSAFNNRPCCPPYYPPPYPAFYPGSPPIPAYPPQYLSMQNNQMLQTSTPVHGGITENINIYNK